jgi:hypothetical protein
MGLHPPTDTCVLCIGVWYPPWFRPRCSTNTSASISTSTSASTSTNLVFLPERRHVLQAVTTGWICVLGWPCSLGAPTRCPRTGWCARAFEQRGFQEVPLCVLCVLRGCLVPTYASSPQAGGSSRLGFTGGRVPINWLLDAILLAFFLVCSAFANPVLPLWCACGIPMSHPSAVPHAFFFPRSHGTPNARV